MKQNKTFWWLSGWFLMAALLFGFGSGTLRAQDTYKLVTDLSDLGAGDEVLLVAPWTTSAYYVMTPVVNNPSGTPTRKAVSVTVNDNTITNPALAATAEDEKAAVIVLERNGDGTFAFKDKVSGKYYATVSNKNGLTLADDPCYYTITSFAEGTVAGSAEIYGSTDARYIRYNNTQFLSYNSEFYASKGEVVFYKKDAPKGAYMQADETAVRYKIIPGTSLDESLVFKAGNLEHDVAVAVKSADAGRENAVIEVDKETINVDDATSGFDLDLSTSADLEEGEYSDIITLTSGDIKVEVTVKLVVKEADVYQLVTKVSKLKDGDVVLIVGRNGGTYYAMDAETIGDFGKSARLGVEVQVTDNAIVDPEIATTAEEENPCEITLVKNADGNYAFQDKVNNKYIQRSSGSVSMGATAHYFTVSVNGETGAAKVNPTSLYTSYMLRLYDNEFKFLSTTTTSNDIYFYRKQIPEDLICHPVTMPEDGGVTPTKTSVEIIWNASEDEPDNGYRVTVTGEGYNKSKTVTDGTQIEWDADLSPEATYTYAIVSLCGENFESESVTGTFTTLAASAPILDIVSPDNNTVFTGNVDFTFTTEDFDLDASHLVKAEVKAQKEQTADQAAAPVLKTVYTQASPVTISGLADGKYHVDLYMVEVTEKDGKKDTAVVGFNSNNYVHRNIEVKRPALYFASKTVKINTFLGVEGSGKVKVTGWALPENATVSLASDNAKITVTPATLTQAQVMATGGAEITFTFNGDVPAATAAITATCNDITATLAVNAVAKDTLVNLKAIYGRANNDTVMVRGKMVVTYKNNSSTSRVYVQDVDKENGASMLLYRATLGYTSIAEGDVLENVAGRVEISNGRYRFIPIQTLKASEKNHAIYVDTMSLLDVRAKSATSQAQNALVCIKDVKFKETGYFTASKNYTLLQGKDTLVFRTEFTDVDYLDYGNRDIPTYSLYVTVFVGYDNGARVTARSRADMVEAPCLVPTDFSEEVSSDEATMEWEGPASNYSVRYATTEADLESATATSVSKKSFTATGLTPLTTYYYQVKSVCRSSNQSDWSDVKSFTTAADTDPSVNMTSPVNRPVFTDSVRVSFRVRNVTLKAEDTSARIVFSDGFTVDNYTDTVYKRAMPTGDYSVQVKLVKDNAELEPKVQTQVRYFSVDLPDVANPVFAPRAGRYKDSVEVTLSCTTQGATIFYAKGDGEYTAYTAGEKILLKESATFKAFACKERMDTSAVVSATYTIYSKLEPEGDLIFAENFNKSTKASTTDISNFGKVTDMSGWTGANMYAEVGEIKGGTSSKAGKLVSREIDLSHDNGKYYVAFFARAFNNNRDSTKIRLTAGDETVLVSDLDKTEMSEYVYMFNNGTAHTRLTFEALAASYNRFYLDSICVYQKLPEVPTIIAPATLSMATVQGTPATQTVTVRGKLLAADITVSCPEGNFSVSPATLDKEAVMSEDGAEFTVTFNGAVLSDEMEITLACGDLTETIKVTATAEEVGGGDDECEAPTQLNAVVADQSVTLTWNGDAEKYRVVVALAEDTVCNELVEAKSYELKDLEEGIYSWSVASVCEDGEAWANGEAFEIREPEPPVSNEGAEGLAFRIYPNPTAGVFYVEVAESARMEIFTVGGVMIRNTELTEGKNEIRLDRSGIYFVRLTSAHGAAVNRVIVR